MVAVIIVYDLDVIGSHLVTAASVPHPPCCCHARDYMSNHH